jgi:hypothetical protein
MTCSVYVIEWANRTATRDGRGTRSDVIPDGSHLAQGTAIYKYIFIKIGRMMILTT